MTSLVAATYISDPGNAAYVRLLCGSCRYFDIPLVTLQRNVWTDRTVALRKQLYWRLFGKKFKWKRRWLDRIDVLRRHLVGMAPEQIVIFTDGYDVFYQTGAKEILQKYHDFEAPIVFSAEKRCYPDSSLANRFPPKGEHRFLNAGGYIGRVRHLLEGIRLFQAVDASDYPHSDQYRWTRVALENPDLVALDVDSRIFRSMSPGESLRTVNCNRNGFTDPSLDRLLADYDLGDGRLRVRRTSEQPCVLHFNGAIGQFIDDPAIDPIKPWLQESTSATPNHADEYRASR